MEKQLDDFGTGAHADTATDLFTAHRTVKDRQSIRAMSNYLSDLDPSPNATKGPGVQLPVGREIYSHIYAGCRGTEGLGSIEKRVPRLAGQRYPCLRKQIEDAAQLHREFAPVQMTSSARGISVEDKAELSDYTSLLGGSESPLTFES